MDEPSTPSEFDTAEPAPSCEAPQKVDLCMKTGARLFHYHLTDTLVEMLAAANPSSTMSPSSPLHVTTKHPVTHVSDSPPSSP
ncbi:hypothetical protein Pelo_17514 [Pelomyxa schiedti]|nr:hypothetical protein Pelo_17514 [Pelomyxa schiedti]